MECQSISLGSQAYSLLIPLCNRAVYLFLIIKVNYFRQGGDSSDRFLYYWKKQEVPDRGHSLKFNEILTVPLVEGFPPENLKLLTLLKIAEIESKNASVVPWEYIPLHSCRYPPHWPLSCSFKRPFHMSQANNFRVCDRTYSIYYSVLIFIPAFLWIKKLDLRLFCVLPCLLNKCSVNPLIVELVKVLWAEEANPYQENIHSSQK